MGDRRKCQTYTASPAEPGGLPVMLDTECEKYIICRHNVYFTGDDVKSATCSYANFTSIFQFAT